MPTAVETTTTIQDQLFQSIQSGQRAVVESVRQWSETVELIASRLPELAFSEPMRPTQVFEAGIGFTERLVPQRLDGALGVRLRRPHAARPQARQPGPFDRRIPVGLQTDVPRGFPAAPKQLHHQAMSDSHDGPPASTFGCSTTRSPGRTTSATRSEPSRCRPSRSSRA